MFLKKIIKSFADISICSYICIGILSLGKKEYVDKTK